MQPRNTEAWKHEGPSRFKDFLSRAGDIAVVGRVVLGNIGSIAVDLVEDSVHSLRQKGSLLFKRIEKRVDGYLASMDNAQSGEVYVGSPELFSGYVVSKTITTEAVAE